MRRFYIAILFVIAIAGVSNLFYVTLPAYSAKGHDPRNESVTMFAHMRWGIDPSTVVIDLWTISDDASMVDVDRSLFDIAEGLSSRSFSTAQLAFRGNARFQMDGSYFQTLGNERSFQNPVYVIRTLPEHLRDMDGAQAFSTWTGGWLGVINQQMEDHKQMHRIWYISEMM